MTEVAIRAARVVVRTPVVPVANDTGSEYQKREKRQRNPENPDRLSHLEMQTGDELAPKY